MKFPHCFVDEKGNVWKDSTLIEASKKLKLELFDHESVSFDEVIRWKIVNVRDHVSHYKRVRDADCSIPIILRSDGYPMDGWHRIIKAKAERLPMQARRFIKNPDPDFINE